MVSLSNHEDGKWRLACHDDSPTRVALWAFFLAIAPPERLRPVRTLRQAQDGVWFVAISSARAASGRNTL